MAAPNESLQSIRTLHDATQLAAKRRELETFRSRDKIDWTLNREFYKGHQWSFWNKAWPGGGRLETDPTDEGDKPHYKVRLTSNQILPGVQHYIAQLTKNRPVIYATPDSGSDRDLQSAQMGTSLLEYWWQDFNLGAKLQSALTHTALSQGYWFISWDKLAGKAMNYMTSPQGQPLIDWADDDLDIYRDELRQANIDPQNFQKTMYVGDIDIKVLPGENILLDPTASHFEDAQYAIITVNMDPDDVKARWPKVGDLTADAVPGDDVLNLSSLRTEDQRMKSVRRVYHLFVRPGAASPKGRYVCWIEGPNMILEDAAWYLPFTELPLVKFPGIERPNSPLDIPLVTPARPLQKEMNRTISQVVEHKNLTLRPQVLAPVGSLSERLTNEPGRTIFFNPIGGAVPQWRDMPQLPAYVYEHLADLQRRLDVLFNKMPSGRDQLPARIDSGSSIDLIQEATADQISPVIQRMESALVRAGGLMVQLAQKFYIEPRLLKIKGANGAVQVKKFMNSDLQGGFSFHAEAGSGLPRTRAGKQSRIEFMLQNQLIDQRTALKFLDTADMSGVLARFQSSEEQAYRTIEKMKQGQPLNMLALQQAQQQAQQMMADPTVDSDGDGQPDSPQEKEQQAQQMIQQAAVAPADYEDPQVHLDVLMHFMSSVEYEGLPPEIQTVFTARLDAMFQRNFQLTEYSQQMQAPVVRPRVMYQIRSAASAPVAGEILRDAGVQIQDEQVASPPLDSWVTEDLSKPVEHASGDTQPTPQEQMQVLQQQQETHMLKMAKAAQDVSSASAHADAAQQQNEQAAQAHALEQHRKEQMHMAQIRAAHARAQQRPKQPA